MKSIQVPIPALLSIIKEMSNDHMECVRLTISDEVIDQSTYYPAFLHFEAYKKDASVIDYESLDAVTFQAIHIEQTDAV